MLPPPGRSRLQGEGKKKEADLGWEGGRGVGGEGSRRWSSSGEAGERFRVGGAWGVRLHIRGHFGSSGGLRGLFLIRSLVKQSSCVLVWIRCNTVAWLLMVALATRLLVRLPVGLLLDVAHMVGRGGGPRGCGGFK